LGMDIWRILPGIYCCFSHICLLWSAWDKVVLIHGWMKEGALVCEVIADHRWLERVFKSAVEFLSLIGLCQCLWVVSLCSVYTWFCIWTEKLSCLPTARGIATMFARLSLITGLVTSVNVALINTECGLCVHVQLTVHPLRAAVLH
jgi:hypothetical protein